MGETRNEMLTFWLTLTFAALVIGMGIVLIVPVFQRCRDLCRQEAELVERIEAKKRQIAQLVDCQNRFQTDPDFVEQIARKNHRFYPGELVFYFGKGK